MVAIWSQVGPSVHGGVRKNKTLPHQHGEAVFLAFARSRSWLSLTQVSHMCYMWTQVYLDLELFYIKNIQKDRRTVAFTSRKFSSSENNYPIH